MINLYNYNLILNFYHNLNFLKDVIRLWNFIKIYIQNLSKYIINIYRKYVMSFKINIY